MNAASFVPVTLRQPDRRPGRYRDARPGRRSTACWPSDTADDLDVLLGERQLDHTLNREAVVGKEQGVRHRDMRAAAARRRSGLLDSRARVLVDEIDDVLHRRAGEEDAADAHRVQLRDIHVGNDAADDDQHVGQPLLAAAAP